MKKLKALTLIELIVSLTITSLLLLLLINIMTKRITKIVTAERGTYYCWKDWDGNLWEKTPSSSIHSVSRCKLTIPNTAKNIQTFIVGGGASGDNPNITNIGNTISNYTATKIGSVYCIDTGATYDGYTRVIYTITGDTETIAPDSLDNFEIKKATYSADYITDDLISEFLNNNHCVVAIHTPNNTLYKILPKNATHYYMGEQMPTSCNNLSGATCYKEGFIYVNNVKTEATNFTGSNPNSLSMTYVKDFKFNKKFNSSAPGNVKTDTAEAGREYIIEKNQIGNGGKNGANGGNTTFGDTTATGGKLTKKTLNISTKQEIKSIDDLRNKTNTIRICDLDDYKDNCKGTLISYPFPEGVSVNNISLDTDFNPANINKEQIKTGFGLFGASGVARDCSISYKVITEFKYNDIKIDKKAQPYATISCRDNFTGGMGGAVIIKWD